jgi:DNA-binding MarR family transcriptional regulator
MHMHLLQVHLFWATLAAMPELDDDTLAAWRAFLTAHARVTRAIGRDLAAEGLPELGWYDLLWTLYRQPGRRLRVNQLAREVALTPTAMSRFVDRVETAGYVRREPDPDDRRALQIAITDEGVGLLRRMWPVYARGIQAHFAPHAGPGMGAMLDRMAAAAPPT